VESSTLLRRIAMKTKKRYNRPSYKNLDCIPTWKLQAIVESPNCTGIDGRDYGPVRHELEEILLARIERIALWEQKKRELGLDKAIEAMMTRKDEAWEMDNGGYVAIPPRIITIESEIPF
jgi:hypothetical protein